MPRTAAPRLYTPREVCEIARLSYDHWMRKVGGVLRLLAHPDFGAAARPHAGYPGRYLFDADLVDRIVQGERVGGRPT